MPYPCVHYVRFRERERDAESKQELGVALGLLKVCAIGSILKSGASPLSSLRHWGFLPPLHSYKEQSLEEVY